MEYRMKCDVCGKIFCYTDEDLKENSDHAKTQTIAALGALAATLGGTTLQTHHLAGQANRHASKIVDYTQCPHCHSRSISVYTGDDTAQAVTNTPTATIKNINTSAPTESLLKRAFLFLEDEEWETADAYCEACLDKDPELAEAYLGKLLAELHVKTQTELKDLEKPFDDNGHYRKILRFANDELKNTLSDYIAQIHNRNEENARKDDILCKAKSMMNSDCISECEEAITLFTSIAGWKSADELRNICHQRLANLQKKEEEDRQERERLAKLKDQGVKGRIIIHAPDVYMGVCHFNIYLGKEKVASIERGEVISIDIEKDSKLQVSVGPNLKSSPYLAKSDMLTELDFSINRLTYKCTPIVRRLVKLDEGREMFCHNCGHNLGNSKFCPKCGTKVALEETTSIKKEDQIQAGSTSNTIVVLEKKEQSPVAKFLRLSIVWIFKAIAYFLYGIAILGGIVYITEKAFLDCFIVLFVLGGGGWFCHFIARKISGITPEKKKKQKLNRTQIILLIIALICAVLCAVIVTSTDECENGHQWQAATLEKPYTCSACGATRGEPALPCSECEMTGLIACDNCDELGQATCSVCNGEKLADCPDCKGSGKVNCTSCAGSGKGGVEESRCYKCGGNGQIKSTCSNCGGVGSVVIRSYGNTSVDDCLKCAGKGSVYKECTFCDGAGTKKSFKNCNQCNGSGTIKDEQCNGKGKVPCTNCNDDGIEVCSLCEKTKQIICDNCEGTGLIQNVQMTSVTLTAFNLEEDNDREVCSSIPSSDDYLHYKFKFESLESGKTYTLRHRTQWPGQEATLADWVWEDVKDGDIRGCEWKNGYTTSNADTLVIEILNDETGEVLGKFEMEVK